MGCSEEGEEGAPVGAPDAGTPQAEDPSKAASNKSATDETLNAIPVPKANAAVDNGIVPTEAECNAALASMEAFTEKIGQKPPKKKERKEFLRQCENWSRADVQCLKNAVEPPQVLECMKPIAEQEMKREIVEAKKTVPTQDGAANRTLAPKKVKKRGGAAARRMESFKKAVGKE
jgi:hypothetical protein